MDPSRTVISNQTGIHPRLAATVRRHLDSPCREPAADYNIAAYETLVERLGEGEWPLVLDSFCGTGQSTASLAERHPDHLIVGIDRSAARIARHVPAGRDNYLILRAECEPLWKMMAEAGLRLRHHYILYPNPWPKSKHLQRRVHGHPGFVSLLELGGTLELRSNWQLYVEEFGLAMFLAGRHGRIARLPQEATAQDLSLFEKKYRLSGHELWSCKVELG